MVEYDVEFNSGAFFPAAAAVELAKVAEDAGFGAAWKGESNSTDPLVLLSAMAARTSSIKLGTAIYHVFGRSPVTLGIQAATLQDLSGGRLLIGLGVANANIASWHGSGFDRPIRRIREYAQVVRLVASGERVDHDGEIYSAHNFRLSWRPSYPRVPIFFAGLGEQMTRQTGQVADGIIVNLANPQKVMEIVGRVRKGAEAAGRDPGQLEYVIKVRCSVHRDREQAKGRLKQVLTFYNLADYYRDMLVAMGLGEQSAAIVEAYKGGGFRAALAAVPDSMLEALPLIAATSVEEVRDRLQPYVEAGATRLDIPYVPATEDVIGETRAFLSKWRP